MKSSTLTYNDVLENIQLTINRLMKPTKRKKIIENVFFKDKENR